MHGEIVTIGRELLMGEIVDTNTSYLAQELAKVGVTVRWASQVGDDLDHLVETFRRALDRSDVIVAAGGLGPTSDDLTREAVAKAIGEQTYVDAELLEWLEGVFRERGFDTMPPTNIKQAWLVPSAQSIPNLTGTAPGWWVQKDGRHIILTPGPPRENKLMWESQIAEKLRLITGADVLYSRTLKTAGITEGGIDEMLSDLFGKENPYLGIYARTDGIHLRIIARAPSHDEASALATPVESQIRERLGNAIWGTDEETAASRVLGLLAAQGRTLGVLEGASGGTVASMFGDLPDPRAVYRGSLAVNQTEALTGATLESLLSAAGPGADGEETALAMASAARKLLGADIGLGISPRSGQNGGDADGAVWVGMASDRGHKVVASRFARGRANSAFRAGMFALIELAAALQAEEL